MKKSSDTLFQLIRSMTKTEKRYFSLFAQRHVLGEKNNYLSLFEAIGKQEIYDEEALKKRFAHEPFSSYFPVAKNQLYHLVLDSLHEYHSEKSEEVKIRRWLHQAQILLEKGFSKEAGKLVQKAVKLAEKRESFPLLLELVQMEKKLISRAGIARMDQPSIDQLQAKEEGYLATINEESTFWYLSSMIYQHHARRATTRDEDERTFLDQLMKHQLLTSPIEGKSFTSRLYFYQIWSTYHFLQGNWQDAYDCNSQRLNLFHDQPEKIADNPSSYLSAMKNFLVDCLNLAKHDELHKSISYIRNLIAKPPYKRIPRLPGDIFRLTYMLELNSLLNRKEFARGTSLVPEIEAGLKRFKHQVPANDQITFSYLIAYLFFNKKEYRKSLKWLSRILHTYDKQSHQHIHATSRLFHLILHYELGNYDILQSLIRSSQRYLKTIDTYFELETVFLRAFRRVINAVDQNEEKEIWAGLRKELIPIRENKAQNQPFRYFNFMEWLEGKIG